VIKETVELNPSAQSFNKEVLGDTIFNGCHYYEYSEGEIDEMRFDSPEMNTGEQTTFTLWRVVDGEEWRFFEDVNILQTAITLEPNLGEITRIDSGEYRYSAPDEIPDSIISVTVNYELYTYFCRWKDGSNNIVKKGKLEDCPVCTPFGGPDLNRYYATGQITLKRDSLYVSIEKDTIYYGDSAQVIIKKRNPDGTLEDFPPTQKFEIAKLEGCMAGDIKVGDSLGTYFNNVSLPIYFMAADSIDDDSTGIIKLRVGLVPNTDYENSSGKIISNACYGGNYTSSKYKDVRANVENPLVILYPLRNSPDEKITSDPQMPEVICKAWLKTNIGEPVKFEWEYKVSYTYQRVRKRNGKPICSRSSESIFRGITWGTGGFTEEWTVPFTNDLNNSFKFIGQDWREGCNQIMPYWDEGYLVFTGGNVLITVTVKAMGSEIVLGKNTQNVNRILGDNPSKNSVISYTNSDEMRAIIEKETSATYCQFTDDELDPSNWEPYKQKGWPYYGAPSGYGLTQIDNTPPATEKKLWNWKSNIDGGKQRLLTSQNEVNDYISKMRATNVEKYRLTNVFQNYNGGKSARYYIWSGNKWEPNRNRGSEYGNSVYKIYEQWKKLK
jgi:hypothetical protein